jgi:hypothetical protein
MWPSTAAGDEHHCPRTRRRTPAGRTLLNGFIDRFVAELADRQN